MSRGKCAQDSLFSNETTSTWLAFCLVLLTSLASSSCGSIGLDGNRQHQTFMKLNGITYQRTALAADEDGLSFYDTVTRKTRSGEVRNGDAEGLEPGTSVYSIAG